MIKPKFTVAAIACLFSLTLALPSVAQEEEAEPAAEATENDDKTRSCISTRTLKTTAVIDDKNVVFVKVGDTVYHNELARTCRGLSKTRQFSYVTTASSLCSSDTISVVDVNGRQGRSCRLGTFTEITNQELIALIEKSRGSSN